MDSEIYDRHDLLGGHFTIEGEPFKSVLDLILEWKSGPDAELFLHLDAVSGGRSEDGKPRTMIYFRYKRPDGDAKREQRKFVFKYTDQMKRRFGNGLVAWSVGSPVYVVV
jgi:hypothetical protein